MVAPLILKIVAFSVAKKVVVFLVAKLYGFPRLYRRVSEFNHYVNRDNPKKREKFKNRLQFLFRLPSHIYQTVQRWRGVQPLQGPPSAPPGQSHGTTNSHSQHKQVREIHTRSSALRVSSLNVPNSSSTLSGLCSISQSIRTHLLGLRGGNQSSRTRPISVSCALPFGVSSLISASKESERLQASSGLHFTPTGSVDGHVVVQIKAASVPESQSGYLRTTIDIAHSVQSCSSQEALKEHSYRSVSETMVSKIDESRNSVQKNTVGLSLLL